MTATRTWILMKTRMLAVPFVLLVTNWSWAADTTPPQISPTLLASIRLARDQANSVGGRFWPDFGKAPFGFLVTLANREVLFCHSADVQGFTRLPPDPTTTCDLQERASVFPKNLLAAMPAIDGISTIVMGTPEATGRSPADWTQTIFHEHFHQYQSTFDSYYSRLNDLGLTNGDSTGMWMLNYPFPYANTSFAEALASASTSLRRAVVSGRSTVNRRVHDYLRARDALEGVVSPDEWKYFELELWTEGVARWTEIEISERTSDKRLQASGSAMRKRTIAALTSMKPRQLRREIVYPYGAAEAMLLERCAPDWHRGYRQTLSLGSLVKAIDPKECR